MILASYAGTEDRVQIVFLFTNTSTDRTSESRLRVLQIEVVTANNSRLVLFSGKAGLKEVASREFDAMFTVDGDPAIIIKSCIWF